MLKLILSKLYGSFQEYSMLGAESQKPTVLKHQLRVKN